jgi:hypothetical protein
MRRDGATLNVPVAATAFEPDGLTLMFDLPPLFGPAVRILIVYYPQRSCFIRGNGCKMFRFGGIPNRVDH